MALTDDTSIIQLLRTSPSLTAVVRAYEYLAASHPFRSWCNGLQGKVEIIACSHGPLLPIVAATACHIADHVGRDSGRPEWAPEQREPGGPFALFPGNAETRKLMGASEAEAHFTRATANLSSIQTLLGRGGVRSFLVLAHGPHCVRLSECLDPGRQGLSHTLVDQVNKAMLPVVAKRILGLAAAEGARISISTAVVWTRGHTDVPERDPFTTLQTYVTAA